MPAAFIWEFRHEVAEQRWLVNGKRRAILQIGWSRAKNNNPPDRKVCGRAFRQFQLKAPTRWHFLPPEFTAAGCDDGAWKSFSVSSD
ncbi:hypothetical protein LB534_27970 [Mesorhizobium sp. CA18]|nr:MULTISPECIES: hypothetical protein [unclassified Mesorhizobium]MBZ9829133.1 hypothetical protein [Mesorhizobium sp. CA18]MBZ9838059.1 hypothetical protein [Mesorhizobium sp. CA3]